MIVTQKRKIASTPPILLEGTPLERADTFKYLGVILSSNLSWTPQVESVCTKARKLLGLLYIHFHNNTGTNTLLELYTTLVRPHLECAAPVWDPSIVNNIYKLEDAQKFALRVCTRQWNMGYQDLLELTNCPTLQNHCLYLKMCTLYKIVHNLIYFPSNVVLPKHNSVVPTPLTFCTNQFIFCPISCITGVNLL